jgi:hypothetical protein
MRAFSDLQKQLIACKKVVYGEIELEHRHEYRPNCTLSCAEISVPGEDTVVLCFDESGLPVWPAGNNYLSVISSGMPSRSRCELTLKLVSE